MDGVDTVRMQASSFNYAIMKLVDDITSEDKRAIYIQPKGSKRYLSSNGVTSSLEYASAKDYPSNDVNLKRFLSLPSALPAVGQVTSAPAIIIRSAGDEEKYITAKIG